MTNVHNIIIRGLNSVYLQAPHVAAHDYKSFIGYSLGWHRVTDHHHYSEEEYFFKGLHEKIGSEVMLASQAEHRKFHDGMGLYHSYLTSLAGKEDQFDSKKLLEIIDGFSGPLYTHLTNEIGALLDLEKLGQTKVVMDCWAEGLKKGTAALTFYDFFVLMPFAFFAHDYTYEHGLHSNFPPLPGPIRFSLRRLTSLWYYSYWKFSPCHPSGVPRKELYAMGGN